MAIPNPCCCDNENSSSSSGLNSSSSSLNDVQTDLCGGFATENCVSGIAPKHLTATVALTDGGGDNCSSTCLAEANGTHALPIFRAAWPQTAFTLEPTGCIPATSYPSMPGQCYWQWLSTHTFTSGACGLTKFDLSIFLLKF